MGMRRLTKLNEFNISFSTPPKDLLWGLLSGANQAVKTSCLQAEFVCVLFYSKVT